MNAYAALCNDLLHHEQHFAARARGACRGIGHDALRRGDDRDSQTTEHLGQFVLAAIDAQPRTADALDAVDDRPAVVIFQFDGYGVLRTARIDTKGADIPLVLQYLEYGEFQLRGTHADRGLARGLRVADAGQKIGDRISHAHCARLTSWPWTDPESRRDWRPRATWCAPVRTCGKHRAAGREWSIDCAGASRAHRAARSEE